MYDAVDEELDETLNKICQEIPVHLVFGDVDNVVYVFDSLTPAWNLTHRSSVQKSFKSPWFGRDRKSLHL